jgi:tRNA pseudouridine38-40 synthase
MQPARMGGSGKSGRKTAPAKRAREGVPVRYRARVEYDGTDFNGFQVQPGGRTVQGELEQALSRLSGGNQVVVEGAGRTDTGVHARGQVIAFTYSGRLGRSELQRAFAESLPNDIGLGPIVAVGERFSPRYQAKHREYRYLIWNGPRSPLRERQSLGVRERLDVAAMAAAAKVFVGRHDFSAFGGADRQPVRTLTRLSVIRRGDLITVTVVGDAFLRGMVRRIVAALLRVGHGKASAGELAAALRERRPAFHGEAAAARGLTLWRVPMGPPRTRKRQEQRNIEDNSE